MSNTIQLERNIAFCIDELDLDDYSIGEMLYLNVLIMKAMKIQRHQIDAMMRITYQFNGGQING